MMVDGSYIDRCDAVCDWLDYYVLSVWEDIPFEICVVVKTIKNLKLTKKN